mgnify:CR=1 FL=1
MSALVERLRTAITERGLTFNKVEHDCKLGNGTIKRWEDQSPRLDKLVLVAQYLHVSLDYLVFGSLHSDCSPGGETTVDLEAIKREQGLTCDGLPLSEDEVDLVAMYRLLPEEQQEDVFDLVQLKYQKHVERKKGSIFWTFTGDKNGGPARSETPPGPA